MKKVFLRTRTYVLAKLNREELKRIITKNRLKLFYKRMRLREKSDKEDKNKEEVSDT